MKKNFTFLSLLLSTSLILSTPALAGNGKEDSDDDKKSQTVKKKEQNKEKKKKNTGTKRPTSTRNQDTQPRKRHKNNDGESTKQDLEEEEESAEEPKAQNHQNTRSTSTTVTDPDDEEMDDTSTQTTTTDNRLIHQKQPSDTMIMEKCAQEIINSFAGSPLKDGKLIREEGGRLTHVILENHKTQQQGGQVIEITWRYKELVEEAPGESRWEHNNQRLESRKIISMVAKKNGEIRETRDEKTETYPYTPYSSSLKTTGDPIISDGIPHSQKFHITKHYKRGDDTGYDKSDGEIILPLTLTHVAFEHNLRDKRSYQIVKGSSEFDGAIYPGLTSYTLKNRPFVHRERGERQINGGTKEIDVYINPQGAFTPERIGDAEAHAGILHLTYAGWRNDDPHHQAYKQYRVEETAEIREYETVGYTQENTTIDAVGNPILENGIPHDYICTVRTNHRRPDRTLYTETRQSQLPVTLTHKDFTRSPEDIRRRASYQVVDIHARHEDQDYLIRSDYTITSRDFRHVFAHVDWDDDLDQHLSTQIERVTIDPAGAINHDSVREGHLLVDEERRTNTQDHIEIWSISKKLPGNNYKIPHSGREYR